MKTGSPQQRENVHQALTLDVVIPVYNEENNLAQCVHRLRSYIQENVPFPTRIIIADNASKDATYAVAKELAERFDDVEVHHIEGKGRGRSLHAVWSESNATVVAYMDVDLSTDLKAFMPLVTPLLSGDFDIAIGSRLARGARVRRGPKRELISRGYNMLLRGLLGIQFSDAQCGFKAMRSDVAHKLLPWVEDKEWFFDTEILVIAESAGLRIHEVPVVWIDDPDSRVDIFRTAIDDLRGVWRVGKALSKGQIPLRELRRSAGRESGAEATQRGLTVQLLRFCVIGILSTAAYAVLYLLVRPYLGAQVANMVTLFVTALANTAANRIFTFGVRGRERVVVHHFQGLVLFGVGWSVTSGSLLLLHIFCGKEPGHHRELMVLIVASLIATVVRFVGLRLLLGSHYTQKTVYDVESSRERPHTHSAH